MFAVTIAFGNTSWRLLYKTAEAAENTYMLVTVGPDKTQHFSPDNKIAVFDDFGQRAWFVCGAITGVMLENLDESKMATIELNLHQQRMSVDFQRRVESDPALRQAAMGRGNGPGIITPMGPPNGRFS